MSFDLASSPFLTRGAGGRWWVGGRLDTLAGFGDPGQMHYPGGKNAAGVYQRLINLMPPHRVYIEPFLGGGAILRLKKPAAVNIGVEIDPAALKSFSAELAESGAARAIGVEIDPAALKSFSAEIAESGAARATLLQADGLEFLRRYKFVGDEMVYCDPPYLLATRSSGKLYRCEMNEADHQQLLRCIRKIPARVMISGYWSQMYASALKGWNSMSFTARTRGRLAQEWVWFNYEEPTALHDYSFLGSGFRERERIKRKKLRWAARLRRLDQLERQALLAVIEAEWFPAGHAGISDGAGVLAGRGGAAAGGGAGVRSA